MRKVELSTFHRLLNIARAQLQSGSRLESPLSSLRAAHSTHSALREGSNSASIDVICSAGTSHGSQPNHIHSSIAWRGSLPTAHGSAFVQQRSFASSGSSDGDSKDSRDTSRQIGRDTSADSKSSKGQEAQQTEPGLQELKHSQAQADGPALDNSRGEEAAPAAAAVLEGP